MGAGKNELINQKPTVEVTSKANACLEHMHEPTIAQIAALSTKLPIE